MQFQNTWNSTFDQIVQRMNIPNEKIQQNEFYTEKKQMHHGLSFCRQQIRINQTDQLIKSLENYSPISQLINLEDFKCKSTVVVKKYRQSIYFGQFIQGKRMGLGIMLYTNGRVFQGEWCNNFKHGKGYEKFQNGAIYSGTYVNGKPQGYGNYSWQNGQTYEGQWMDGMKSGSGIWRGPVGDSYIGQWKNGLANGYGVHTWVNGDRYQGQFKDCLKHGEGIQKFSNGDSYKGNYVMGKPQGYGQYYWAMGSYFKGNFTNGLRNGKGVWKRGPGNTDKYQGQYIQDKKQGNGVYTWQNGNFYQGNFVNDMKHGYGQMFYIDGRVYRGQWVNNQKAQQFDQFVQQLPNNQNAQTSRYCHCEHQKQETFKIFPKSKSKSKYKHNQSIKQNKTQFDINQMKQSFYKEPIYPDIVQNQKKFRAREIYSQKEMRKTARSQKSSRSCIQPNYNEQQNKFVRKYSVSSRCAANKKVKQSNTEPKMASSTFFLYKIHSKPQGLQDSSVRIKQRQVKTSGGMRNKHVSQQIKYFTRNKISPQIY